MPALSKYDHLKDWKSARKALGEKDEKNIGNNTKLVRMPNNDIAVTLHGHRVVRYRKGGVTQVSSAGYRTTTTKDRINRYTPASVSVVQRDYEWYLKKNGKKRDFHDGMEI